MAKYRSRLEIVADVLGVVVVVLGRLRLCIRLI